MHVAVEDGVGARSRSTSFVGRRAEVADLRALLAASRLVTITGPGGVGKTRLAEELVSQVARSFGGAVSFSYLGEVVDGSEVADIIAAAVGLRGDTEPEAALLVYLRKRRFLLVLDNCEHVRGAAARFASRALAACPGVTILTTSRRPLLVPGEQLFAVEGLGGDHAVALFTDRIRLGVPSFVLTELQRPIAAEICRRLDGMPLAIELTAARLRHIGLGELEERLQGRLADLGSGNSVAPPRQRTLRGTIDWSYDLLTDAQRTLWQRLSIFSGGFTLRAAEDVASVPPLAAKDIATLLGELVDASMVSFDLAHRRYRLIEAMREVGLERLRQAGDQAAIAERHAAWIQKRADELHRRWWGPDQAALLDEMAAEAGNLRAALEWCRATGRGAQGLRIATASLWYWLTRASHAEAVKWCTPFLQYDEDRAVAARASLSAAWIAVLSARLADARHFLERAAHLASPEDPNVGPYIQLVEGLVLISEDRLDAALEVCRTVVADTSADPVCASWARIGMGLVAFLGGDMEATRRGCQESIAICRAAGEAWTQVVHLHLLAVSTWQLGDPRTGASLMLDALRIDRRLDDVWHRAWSFEELAWVSADLGRPERAARLLGIAAACWAHTGSNLTPPWERFRDRAVASLRRRLGGVRFEQEFAAGEALDPARAMSFALDEAVEAPPPTTAEAVAVSSRELEVAELLAMGLGNRAIAERLFVSPRTVESHVAHLMDKLGVGSRAEIAAWTARRDRRPHELP